jgi:hypothetical protein
MSVLPKAIDYLHCLKRIACVRETEFEVRFDEESTLCGHPKQGIQGTRNQSVATAVEVGFLGSLCQGPSTGSNRDHFPKADFPLRIRPNFL